MAVIHIKDSESFEKYKDVLDETGNSNLCSTLSVSSSKKDYGIYNEQFGWVKEIVVITNSNEVNVSYTNDKKDALSIVGRLLKGRILLHGMCILL